MCDARTLRLNLTQRLISESEVGTTIDKLNNGKSAEEYGLSSDHFKEAKPVILP